MTTRYRFVPRGPFLYCTASSPSCSSSTMALRTPRSVSPVLPARVAVDGYASAPWSFAQSAIASSTSRCVGFEREFAHTHAIVLTLNLAPPVRRSVQHHYATWCGLVMPRIGHHVCRPHGVVSSCPHDRSPRRPCCPRRPRLQARQGHDGSPPSRPDPGSGARRSRRPPPTVGSSPRLRLHPRARAPPVSRVP